MARGVKNRNVTKFKNTKKKPTEKIDKSVSKTLFVPEKVTQEPKTTQETSEKRLSPRIYRSITELSNFFRLKRLHKLKGAWLYVVIGTVCGILIAGIALVSFDIRQNTAKKQQITAQRVELHSQISKWENVNKQYPGYRDGYFRVAVLAYQVGDLTKARMYVKKTLDVDPYYKEAQALNTLLDNQGTIVR